MYDKLLHTPEGVRDVYNSECKERNKVVEQINHILKRYGYSSIETPTFEYFDIFNYDRGSAHSNEMYKFFDRNNNTLVLRPDITPSVARCVAKYYSDVDLPLRLCYTGKTFTNAAQHQGKLNELTQIGGEFINDDSSAADAEIISCVISALKEVGLDEFMIEIGEVEYFKGIIAEAGLNQEAEDKIRELIQLKNFFGLTEYVSKLDIKPNMKKALSEFNSLFGGLDMLDKARGLVTNPQSIEAIDRMKRVHQAIATYGYDKYVSFDLSQINRYNYYTGIVFNGYTYGTGEAIVKGGRYNNLLSTFGKDAPSIGFAIYVDELMNAISRNNVEVEVDYSNKMLIYEIAAQKEAIQHAVHLRNKGVNVELVRKSQRHDLDEYEAYAKKMHIKTLTYIDSDGNIMDIIG